MNNVYNQLFDAMSQVSKAHTDHVAADLTLQVTILKQISLDIGEYYVDYKGSQLHGFSLDTKKVYKVGDQVYLQVPQGDFNNKKIIVGYSSASISQTEIQYLTSVPITHGPNWMDNDGQSRDGVNDNSNMYHWNDPNLTWLPPLQIISGVAGSEDVGFIWNNTLVNTNADRVIQWYNKTYNLVQLSAKFNTPFTSLHTTGSYWIELELEENITAADGTTLTNIITRQLNFSNFVGDPYGYRDIWQENSVIFEVSKEALVRLRRVTLKQAGMEVDNRIDQILATGIPNYIPNTTQPNIFATDIRIHFVTLEDLTEERYYLDIIEPEGNRLSASHTSLPLNGELRFGREIIPMDDSEVQWFWFKEDITILADGQPNYTREGGVGWRVIGSNVLNEDGSKKYPLLPPYTIDNSATLRVPIAEVPWEWRYKLVVIYSNAATLSAITTVINQDSTYHFELRDFTSTDNEFTYLQAWDTDGNPATVWGDCYLYTPDETYRRVTNPAAPVGETQPWPTPVPPATGDIRMGDMATTTTPVITYPVGLVINDYIKVPVVTFYVGVKLANQGTIIANLQKTYVRDDVEDNIFINWVGKDMYNYDASGNIRFEDKEVDRTLYAELNWGDNLAQNYVIEMLAPDSTILNLRQNYADERGYSPPNSMMENFWLGNFIAAGYAPNQQNNVVHYRIKTKYDEGLTNNRIGIRLTLITGQILTFWKEIQFLKDGSYGTNGGEFSVSLRPIRGGAAGAIWDENMLDPQPLGYIANAWQDNAGGAFQLYLRPFIYYKGEILDNIPAAMGFTYEVYYDCRYPKYTTGLANNSGIRIHDYATNGIIGTGPGLYLAPGQQLVANPNRGAIRIHGYGNPQNSWYNYTAYVKCIVDVFQNGTKVSSITDTYPVDLIIATAAIPTFNKNLLQLNWPQYVQYNPTGYDPQVFNEPLYFQYNTQRVAALISPTATGTGATVPPTNLARIEVAPNGDQLYRPRDYFFWQNGIFGSMVTNANIPTMPGTTRYYRTQIMYLNSFANVDINGWDGTGIDTNDTQGYIFAPTVGAGYKAPGSNTFSGVIMGIDKSQPKNAFANYFPAQDQTHEPWMTGLYGYQNGVSSFGIMENGTAFFGRADRGGRITIDGFNAVMYGGSPITNNSQLANGVNMFNRMRISFVDLETAARDAGQVDVTYMRNAYFVTNDYPTWFISAMNTMWGVANYGGIPGISNTGDQATGAGNSRWSTTAAIEIGQHTYAETMTWRNLFRSEVLNLFGSQAGVANWRPNAQQLKFPGDRNFLVTYDGTLWARNAVFQGFVFASTIVSANIVNQNSQILPNGTIIVYDGAFHTWPAGNNSAGGNSSIGNGVWSVTPPTWMSGSGGTWMTSNSILNPLGLGTEAAGASFIVTQNGSLYAADAHFNGAVTIDTGGIHFDGSKVLFQDGTQFDVVGITRLWGDVGIGGDAPSMTVGVGNFFLGANDQNWQAGQLRLSRPNYMNQSPFSVSPTGGGGPVAGDTISAWPMIFHMTQRSPATTNKFATQQNFIIQMTDPSQDQLTQGNYFGVGGLGSVSTGFYVISFADANAVNGTSDNAPCNPYLASNYICLGRTAASFGTGYGMYDKAGQTDPFLFRWGGNVRYQVGGATGFMVNVGSGQGVRNANDGANANSRLYLDSTTTLSGITSKAPTFIGNVNAHAANFNNWAAVQAGWGTDAAGASVGYAKNQVTIYTGPTLNGMGTGVPWQQNVALMLDLNGIHLKASTGDPAQGNGAELRATKAGAVVAYGNTIATLGSNTKTQIAVDGSINGHSDGTLSGVKAIILDMAQLEVTNYTAEQQKGIYARFG